MAAAPNAAPQSVIDMSQFFQVFFDEAAEHLASMESLLLRLDTGSPDDEDLNAIFRAAHSIKGGAGTFGFTDIAELTHELETLLDRLRKHELTPDPSMVDVMLASGDALSQMLARHRGESSAAAPDTAAIVAGLRSHCAGNAAAPAASAPDQVASAAAPCAPVPPVSMRALELRFPKPASKKARERIAGLLDELGRHEAMPARKGRLAYRLETRLADDEILERAAFVIDPKKISLVAVAQGAPAPAPAEDYGFFEVLPEPKKEDEGFGFFGELPPAPAAAPAGPSNAGRRASDRAEAAEAPTGRRANDRVAVNPQGDQASIRVNVEKVDSLINQVGELVITQAMLAQQVAKLDAIEFEHLHAALRDLDRNTRDLQESAMAIRMLPMSFVFNRFPRMLRDLAAKLGKDVELVTSGESTELDKGLIERIADPLNHLVRNAVDHGIEKPEARAAAGKVAKGTVQLSAGHRGGSIVIEIADDGRGLDREKLVAKARERGLTVSETMSDQEAWQLIFEPGFSTAEQVTDVSGRGVGMDVVKRNILALGGSVELDSAPGHGTRVTVKLPLTLAIMDGMSVGVAGDTYIAPLGSVVETLQADAAEIRDVAGQARVIRVREDYLPVVDLAEVFGAPAAAPGTRQLLVIVEADGAKTALRVDELLGQQQIVVKNLERNYRKVPGVSGATILGDGRVALILDVGALVKRARH